MKTYKIDNCTIKIKKDLKATSNYNTFVHIFIEKDLISIWTEKESTPHLEIVYEAIKCINRYKENLTN